MLLTEWAKCPVWRENPAVVSETTVEAPVDDLKVNDELWDRIQPLLPVVHRRHRWPGRKRLDDRGCLNGILFVLATGIGWERLPQQLGYGSGMTCWRRLRDWQAGWGMGSAPRTAARRAPCRWAAGPGAGNRRLLARTGAQRGQATGPSPVDRGRAGSKHHVLTDASGIPLAVILASGSRNDVTQLIPLLDAVPPIRGRVGRPRRKPRMLVADRGYDHDKYRRVLRARGIRPVIARRGVAHGSGLGRWRWPVERTLAWLHQFRRLRVRWERRADLHEAFLKLASCLICWRRLQRSG
jgi:transposase